MTAEQRDTLWRRYVSSRDLGATEAECRWAFDQWWKRELADTVKAAKHHKSKRERAGK